MKQEKRFVRREGKEVVQKRKRENILFSQKLNAIRKNENIICPIREDTFLPTKRFLAQDKNRKKTFLGFFFKERVTKKKKMFQCFSFFFLGERNGTEEETKTDNEKWKLIEEEPEIRKTNYVKIFLEADKRKNNKNGFKNPSVENKQREHYSEKNFHPKKNWQK